MTRNDIPAGYAPPATLENRRCGLARRWRLCLITFLLPGVVCAGGGPLGIDSELPLDTGGIWARKYQTGIENGVIAVEIAGALWFGNDDKLGHTFWQDIDSTVLSGAAAELLKYGFSRPRPYQGDNPNAWFKGSCCQSFPSGEVTLQAAFVTPLIVNYYKQDTVDLGARGATRLRCHRTPEEPGALADGRHCRRASRNRLRILGDDAQHAAIGSDLAARHQHWYQ